jgi:diacylglycerol kinase (ATP)
MENLPGLIILFVINPRSGGRKKSGLVALIKNYCKDLPHTIEFYILTGKDDTGSISTRIVKLNPTIVVAVGGDGTINLLATCLLGTNLQLGIIPAGSANGMARELNIPEVPERALDIIVQGKIKRCDVVKINDESICLHLSDLGLNARLVKYFSEGKLRGMYGYARMLVKAFWYKKLINAHIIADELDITAGAYMIVIANASRYGTGAMINPDGNISDGLFEIVIVRMVSLLRLVKMLVSDTGVNPKHVEIFKTAKAIITTSNKTHFQVDGEYKGRVDTITAEILPEKLNILVINN